MFLFNLKLGNMSPLLLLLVALFVTNQQSYIEASIETEPVKVTHRNSGPRYELDDGVERTRLDQPNPADNQVLAPRFRQGSEPREQDNNNQSPDSPPQGFGRISVRRIFLWPMVPAGPQPHDSSSDSSNSVWSTSNERTREAPSNQEDSAAGQDEQPSLMNQRPFWHSLLLPPPSPPSRHHHHHLFGTDEASRSPPDTSSSMNRPTLEQPSSSGAERESSELPRQPMIDPIQLMLELMREALNNPQPGGSGPSGFFNDLNKDATSQPDNNQANDNKPASTDLSSQKRPETMSKNETKEEIVEIEGKKYLRKTITNRHVGDSIIFMTRRLVFVPLNETETPSVPTTAAPQETTQGSSTTTPGSLDTIVTSNMGEQPASNSNSDQPKQPKAEEATTTTSTTTTKATPTASEAASSSTVASTTTVASGGPEETTPKDETTSEGPNKASDRLIVD